jgi:hypothetical protein
MSWPKATTYKGFPAIRMGFARFVPFCPFTYELIAGAILGA